MSGHATAPKKNTSVSIAEPLLAEAKALGVNVSQAAEDGLAKAVASRRAELWLQENHEAVQSSNEYVEKYGPVEELRNTDRCARFPAPGSRFRGLAPG